MQQLKSVKLLKVIQKCWRGDKMSKKLIREAKRLKKSLMEEKDRKIVKKLINKVLSQQRIIDNYEQIGENNMFNDGGL